MSVVDIWLEDTEIEDLSNIEDIESAEQQTGITFVTILFLFHDTGDQDEMPSSVTKSKISLPRLVINLYYQLFLCPVNFDLFWNYNCIILDTWNVIVGKIWIFIYLFSKLYSSIPYIAVQTAYLSS